MTDSDLNRKARWLYRLLVDAMRAEIRGHAEAVEHLALLGTLHGLGAKRQRACLIGPSGSGKTLMCTVLARSLDVPFVAVDVASMSETGWSGADVTDYLDQALRRLPKERASTPLVLLDEIDKLSTLGRVGPSYDQRRGKAESLLKLMEGATIVLKPDGGAAPYEWSSEGALIIGAGVFAGLATPAGRIPSPGDVVRLGHLPELVERMSPFIRLSPLPSAELAEVMEKELQPQLEVYRAFGYELRVPLETFRFVAGEVASRELEAGPRSGAAWLRMAAQVGLRTLLGADAPAGSTFELTPDDVVIPAPADRQPPTDGDIGDFDILPRR